VEAHYLILLRVIDETRDVLKCICYANMIVL